MVHDDTPRLQWKLAVVDDLVKGNNDLVHSAQISTASYKTNRPITRLYPLEVVSSSDSNPATETRDSDLTGESTENNSPVIEAAQKSSTKNQSDDQAHPRSKRRAATRAMHRISEWTDALCAPGEM